MNMTIMMKKVLTFIDGSVKREETVIQTVGNLTNKIDQLIDKLETLPMQESKYQVGDVSHTERRLARKDDGIDFIPEIDTKGMTISAKPASKKSQEIDLDKTLETLNGLK